jgi:hypothetical protein
MGEAGAWQHTCLLAHCPLAGVVSCASCSPVQLAVDCSFVYYSVTVIPACLMCVPDDQPPLMRPMHIHTCLI